MIKALRPTFLARYVGEESVPVERINLRKAALFFLFHEHSNQCSLSNANQDIFSGTVHEIQRAWWAHKPGNPSGIEHPVEHLEDIQIEFQSGDVLKHST